ncbi:hypothetical protein AB0I81_05290 [Nonomuraea sp. NPDC050404]|uniref:hypothetical protein n=1 Tax=Nonomuraea sp. NPDC050404 TaxID=3155783 RepID=UPI0033EA0BF6
MTASPCPRCGLPVLPDRQAPGYWLDQWNGRFCGGDQRFPHLAPVPPARSPGGAGLVLWIVAGVVAAVAVLVGAAILFVVMNREASEPATVAQSEREPTRSPTPSADPSSDPSADPSADPSSDPSRPAMPEAAVPCDPARDNAAYCFPDSLKGPEYLQRIKKAMKWDCYEKGEKDKYGSKMLEAECQGRNTVDQSYDKSASISYQRPTSKDDGTMDRVSIVASTAAEQGGTTPRNTTNLARDILDIATTHLWPDNAALRKEAERALVKIQRNCMPDGQYAEVMLSAGYRMTCSVPTPISVRNNAGKVITSITQSVRIEAPFGGGRD